MGTPNPCFYTDNLIANGGFEANLAGWSTTGGGPSVELDANPYNDGTNVIKLSLPDQIQQAGFDVELDRSYVFRAYLKFSDQSALDDASWSIVIAKAGSDELWRLDRSVWAAPVIESYFSEVITFGLPAATQAAEITLTGPGSAGSLIVDVISLGLIDNATCEGANYQLQAKPDPIIFKAHRYGPNPDPQRLKISGDEDYYDPATGWVNFCQDWTITAISSTRVTSDLMSGTDDCNDPVNMPMISFDTQNLPAGLYEETITITAVFGTAITVDVLCYVLPGSETEFDPVDVPCVFAQG